MYSRLQQTVEANLLRICAAQLATVTTACQWGPESV